MTQKEKGTGIHKKGSPKADSESGRISTLSFPRRRKSGKGDESGRSMVEMLGVLAIMGLLAIGGIMAYRYAVTKYQANETFNELRRRVVVHSQQSIIGTPLSQVEMGDTTQLGYPIAVARVDSGFFELTLQDIDNNLCREMVRTGWTLPTQTRVNGVVVGTNPEACGEENSLVFRFQTEMGGCKTDADCPCGACANGTCRTSCAGGESCVKNFDDGQYVCCPSGKVVGNSCCEYPGENGTCCDENSKYCCPPDKPLIDSNGKCWACEDTAENIWLGWNADRTPCQKCSNRYAAQVYNSTVNCALPCPEGQFRNMDGKCLSCSADGWVVLPQSECMRCSDRFIGNWGGGAQGRYRCDFQSTNFGAWVTNEIVALCEKNCPNRTLIQHAAGVVCALNCPTIDQVLDQQGQCHTCDEESEYFDVRGILDSCYQCEGIRFIGDNINRPTNYFRCDSPQQSIFLSWEWTGKNEDTIGTC